MAEEEHEDAAFDRIMKLVGNDGKFQRVFNNFYNVALVSFASMSFMNIVMVLNEPEHMCNVLGRENYSMSVDEWINLTIPL
jgi:OCT family organic cation transporter-like MFS transporter 4/5